MPVLDIEAIRAKKQEILTQQAAAVAWCTEALLEYPNAAQQVGTPVRGNPEFLKHVYGADSGQGVWPILREDSDNFMIEIGHGASYTMTDKFWLKGKHAGHEDVAWWIAARCHYSVDVMRDLFEAALLGSAWTVSTALSRE
jgi:hypothetical protein